MAQQGFVYESNAYAALQKYNISTGGTAGASHDKPDLTIQKGKKKSGVELKLSPTAAGSLVMKYTNGKWDFGDIGDDPEKKFLVALAKKANLLKEMNDSGQYGAKWRKAGAPCLQNDAQGKKIIVPAKLTKAQAYAKDIARFGASNEVHIPVTAKAICDYYIAKKCSYINVGTTGFYTLNGVDELGLNAALAKNKHPAIPNFASATTAKIRIRCQNKGGGDYQFVMTLQFGSVKKSPYNIAPMQGTGIIDKTKLDKDPIITAF
jgi:hypothetical protein